MIHGTINTPDSQRAIGNVTADDLATNQQSAYHVVIGERLVPCLWIGQIYNQFTVEVRQSTGGKK